MARTPIRSKMHEPYRTLLGHFRHGVIRPDICRRGELPQSDVMAVAVTGALNGLRSTGMQNASAIRAGVCDFR